MNNAPIFRTNRHFLLFLVFTWCSGSLRADAEETQFRTDVEEIQFRADAEEIQLQADTKEVQLRADAGKIQLPLSQWQAMIQQQEAFSKPPMPPMRVLQMDREIEGRYHKGVFSGSLVARFEVLPGDGHVRVPVLDRNASIREVRLDGRQTSLLRGKSLYSVGVEQAGIHKVRITFLQGKEDDRFARRLQFHLPPSGPSKVSVWLPEQGIEAQLAQGTLTSLRLEGKGTQVLGQLDGRGLLDLSWKRRPSHRPTEDVRTEVRLNTLFTLHEALIRGVTSANYSVLEGELDRLALRLPAPLEVVGVHGPAVLQWQTEDNGQVVVLLRHLVEDRVTIQVHFRIPVQAEQEVLLQMPYPVSGDLVSGTLGIQGPTGLQAKIIRTDQATALTLRDLPSELTELSTNPLLHGFRFTAFPTLALTLTRHQAVELTSTVVDDIQASTVLIEDGYELSKLRLRLRNNTRQYLTVKLPEGAVLTHSLVDGHPIRPALGSQGLLFPLRQSKRFDGREGLTHTVRAGDTLSGLAVQYYSDPTQWEQILAYNSSQLYSEEDLIPGQRLRIPFEQKQVVKESSFVIELAYKRKRPALGWWGQREVLLPSLDVDAVAINWHLYVPKTFLPLDFTANLTQHSNIRYGPLRRALDFMEQALIRRAWAGGDYESILTRRKSIYQAESKRRQGSQEVVSAFPLVGEKHRFKRLLLGQDTPRIVFWYLRDQAIPPLRWAALFASLGLGLLWFGTRVPRRHILTGAGLTALLLLAYYLPGIHRRILWGVDLALVLVLFRSHSGLVWTSLKRRLDSPVALLDLLRWHYLAFALLFYIALLCLLQAPMLFSTAALLLLLIGWRWTK